MNIYRNFGKRLFDIFISLIILFIASPVLLFIIIIQILVYRGDIFYSQKRHTKGMREFNLYKFRSMVHLVDKDNKLLPDERRITRFGKFLRLTSLDELPNLVNVLKGDLSIVGPRPLPVGFSDLMTSKILKRYEVNSGLTGLAQVSGRNSISWNDKFKLDLIYIQNITFVHDIKILVLTIKILGNFKNNKNSSLFKQGIDKYNPNFEI